jgi:flavodoxin I
MKVLVIYDSLYGNTEKVAKAIAAAITDEAKVHQVTEANPGEFKSIDLLIVGSPTQGGNATKTLQTFMNNIPVESIKGVKVATFDTRLASFWVKIFGFAAGRMARYLKSKGAVIVGSPEGFIVSGSKGPLKEGELERAAAWAKSIAESKK